MKTLLLRLYDYLTTHRLGLWVGLSLVLLPLVYLAVTLRYDEDIMEFLPVTAEEKAYLENVQSQQSATRMVLIVEGEDEDRRSAAIDDVDYQLSTVNYQLSTLDADQLSAYYSLLPYLMPDSVYAHLDSLLTPEAIRAALQRDRTLLSIPGTSMLGTAIQYDPLGLLNPSPVTRHLSTNKSYAFIDSPYGSTETRHNAAWTDSLTAVTDVVARDYPELKIRWVGAPIVAVGNARRIKTDTLLCIALSSMLIILLLAYAFPRRRDLWLILLAVSFGWLTGMAVLHMVTPTVSAVVLGIGSVLIGIAVNYPLHLLVHRRYTASVRQTLDEVLSPLVVGNITTVGAFLALLPLESAALRQLGCFAGAMLIGTILFCIFVMPHLMSAEPTPIRELKIPHFRFKISNLQSPISNLQSPILILTLLLGAYLLVSTVRNPQSSFFDSNLSHINYMTPQQRADMAYFDSIGNPQRIMLDNAYKADLWQAYWLNHSADSVIACVQTEAKAAGFRPEAFGPFYDMLQHYTFDTPQFSYNDIARRLSDDFDYIGLCCSLIVFVFLWLSFRNLWLALIAFVPMALSWIWILAIMQMFGLQFNIVNVILATFIFGQGDDYTIFIVEGLLYEHRTGKPILPQYRQSILLSALIMLIGIGILVIAVHPAMHSLGVLALLGMSVVLLMALTVPPLLFRLLTAKCKI